MKSSFSKLINGDKPVLIDFHALWCGPCKMMNPIIKTIATKWKDDLRVVKIDIDKNKNLSQQLKIKGVPTFMIFKNGEQVWRQSGGLSETGLSAEIEKIVK